MKTSTALIRLSLVAGWLVILFLAFSPQGALAATCTSASDGNWSTISWTGCTSPGASDDVVIAHNVTLDVNTEVVGVTINSGKTLDGGSHTLTLNGTYFTNNGTFTANTGTVRVTGANFRLYGSATTFNNVTLTGNNADFATVAATIGGTFRIEGGYVATGKAPTYSAGSTLRYATGGTCTAGEEWYPNTTSGPGVPHHVDVASGTTMNFGSTAYARTMKGNLTLDGAFALSTAVGGDLNIAGNWTNNGTFNANSRLVTFNGSGAQSIGGSSTTTFAYVSIGSASSTTLAQNANVANDFEVNGTFSVADKTLTLQNGTDLEIKSGGTVNGGSGTIVLEGNSSNNPDFINAGTFNAGTGTVHFKGQSTTGNYRNGRVWGPSATTFNNVTLTYTGSGTGGYDTFGVDFYDQDSPAVRATINGVLALNTRTFVAHAEVGRSGGSCSSRDCGAPTYGSGSTLRYNDLEYKEFEPDPCPGSPEDNPYQVFGEWLNATSGHGVPHHVTVGSDSWASLYCNPGTSYRVNGDFTVEAGVDGNTYGGAGTTPPASSRTASVWARSSRPR